MTDTTSNQHESLLRLHMLAAIWGSCYPEEREFVTVWAPTDTGQLKLADAADSGSYSLQVEGALVRYAMNTCKAIDPEQLPQVQESTEYTWSILRSDWKPEMATPELWEQLRKDLYAAFYKDGQGFFANDLKFADLAIDKLKPGGLVVASSCSRLPEGE